MKNNNQKGLIIIPVLFALVLIIGAICSSTKVSDYTLSSQETIDYLMDADYEILPEDVAYYVDFDEPGYLYLDLRNPYEFNKGNVATSFNIPQNSLLDEDNLALMDDAQRDSLTVVLIHTNQAAATGPWLILKQMGYDNIQVMKGGWDYYANESLDPYDMPDVPKYMVEEPAYDFVSIMEMMKAGPATNESTEEYEVIIPKRKKKTTVVEGGC